MDSKKHNSRVRSRKINLTLLEAEERHLLDCPNAEFAARFSAFLLDAILFYLIASGLEHLCSTLNTHVSNLPLPSFSSTPTPREHLLISFVRNAPMFFANLSLALKLTLYFIYFPLSVSLAGGTPAKLWLGLKVIDRGNGRYLDFPRAFFRETFGKVFAALPLFYGFVTIYLRKDRAALHDQWTRSFVKKVHGVR